MCEMKHSCCNQPSVVIIHLKSLPARHVRLLTGFTPISAATFTFSKQLMLIAALNHLHKSEYSMFYRIPAKGRIRLSAFVNSKWR